MVDQVTGPHKSESKLHDQSTQRGVAQAFLLFFACIELVLILGSGGQMLSLVSFDSVLPGLAFTEVALILLPALAFLWWKRLSIMEGLQLRPVPVSVAGLSVCLGIGSWGVAFAVYLLTVPIVGEFPNAALEATTLPGLLVLLLCAAVLPGICEEALFRGVIQGVFRRRGSTWSIVMTSILFGLFHLHPSNILPPILLGLVLGILVERTGSIVPAMLMHFAVNSTAFTVHFVLGQNEVASTYPLMAVLAIVFVISFSVFWRITSANKSSLPRLANVPAGLRDIPGRTLRRLGTVAATILVFVFVAALQFVGSFTMTSDQLAPEVRKGEAVIVLKQRWVHSEIEPGMIVSFQREGKVLLRKVTRVEDDHIWIAMADSTLQIERQQVASKVIYVVRTQ